jgi:hypothetical protein
MFASYSPVDINSEAVNMFHLQSPSEFIGPMKFIGPMNSFGDYKSNMFTASEWTKVASGSAVEGVLVPFPPWNWNSKLRCCFGSKQRN